MNSVDKANLTGLDAIKEAIREVLSLEVGNKTQWVAIKLDLCRLFAMAKAEAKSDKDFGKWCDQNFSDVNKQDRAAYAGMGADLEWAENVLNATERKSIQWIYHKEFVTDAKPKKGNGRPKGSGKAKAEQAKPSAASIREVVKPVFTKDEFNLLLKVCHPDKRNVITVEEMTAATALLNVHKKALVIKEPKKAKTETPTQEQPVPEAA